jgi:anaerobic ribonucleoside-triphosphate reductase
MIKQCPNCGKEYETVLERPIGDNRPIQQIFPKSRKWEREQLITGICSNKCWDEYLGI